MKNQTLTKKIFIKEKLYHDDSGRQEKMQVHETTLKNFSTRDKENDN